MTAFLPPKAMQQETKTKAKKRKKTKVSLMIKATGVAQQKAIRQKGFSLLEEDFQIIQLTAINATVYALSNSCAVLVFERISMYNPAALSSSKWYELSCGVVVVLVKL